MTKGDKSLNRPRSTQAVGIGTARYVLLRDAFRHVQSAILDGYPIEAISVLESLLTDRLGSMVHGSLGATVTLRHTLGGLATLAEANVLVRALPASESARRSSSRKAPFPADLVDFVRSDIRGWWNMRSDVVHAMAKLKLSGNDTFVTRHRALMDVALDGVRILLVLDAFDRRERTRNGAGRPATDPDALAMHPDFLTRYPMNS